MKTNTKTVRAPVHTHEGAPAKHINAEAQLRRSVMSCMLFEGEFYEDGQTISQRIAATIPKVKAEKVAEIAVEAREKMKLRHAPLFIVREMARLASHRHMVAQTLATVIQRADELSEFVAIYWKDGRQSLSAQVKRGLAKAFTKFNEYALAKYDRDGAVKLRDVLFLSHAKPENKTQGRLWKKLVDGKLKTPDTWEVSLSAGEGEDKKASWERLLANDKLGALALLRNLRNMIQAGVAKGKIRSALADMKTERVLPFRFISAARHAPDLEPDLEKAMFRCLEGRETLDGQTVLLVDVSGSMNAQLSGKSDLTRIDAACGLAMLLREICEDVTIFTFSDYIKGVPPRRGFALRDAINESQPHHGTYLGKAVAHALATKPDRLIVISDEQSHDPVPSPKGTKAYMLNVASARNGVGYGPWTHVDGFSEAVVDYVIASEK